MRAFLFSLAILAGTVILAGTLVNTVVAMVDGDPITLYDLKEMIDPVKPDAVTVEKVREMRETVVKNAVEKKLVQQAVEELDLTVSDADLDRAVRQVAQQNGGITVDELKTRIESEGIEWSEYRDEVLREQLAVMQLKKHVAFTTIDVDESDLRELYQREYASKTVLHLSRIVIPVGVGTAETDAFATLSDIRQKIVDGDISFEEAARKYSAGEAASEGGVIGKIPVDQMNRIMAEHVVDLEKSGVSKPFKSQDSWQLFRVNDIVDEPPPPFASVRDRLRQMYYVKNMEDAFSNWLMLRRKKSRVKHFDF